MYSEYWNFSNEDLIHEAFTHPARDPLAYELAVRLERCIEHYAHSTTDDSTGDLFNGFDDGANA